MPKKSKREKLLAEYRRKIKSIQQASNKYVSDHKNKISVKSIDKIGKVEKTVYDLKYFYQDLRKSSILIIAIITLEVVFYFVKI